MSIETVARQTLYRQTHARGGNVRSLANRALLRRIWYFASRHHRRMRVFIAVSVLSALLAVATPLLAGKVVDEIVGGGSAKIVVLLAALGATPSCTKHNSVSSKWQHDRETTRTSSAKGAFRGAG